MLGQVALDVLSLAIGHSLSTVIYLHVKGTLCNNCLCAKNVML